MFYLETLMQPTLAAVPAHTGEVMLMFLIKCNYQESKMMHKGKVLDGKF